MSLHTVATHRKRIAAKLGTKGNQLTRRAIMLHGNAFALQEALTDGVDEFHRV